MRLIPAWMPFKLFWTCFVGVALFAAALSLILRVQIRLSASPLGIMFFCFVVMMDLPAAIAAPQKSHPVDARREGGGIRRRRDSPGHHEHPAATNPC
jgi:hypothetical protein